MERVERIELSTKPWQGLVLPLAPYPHHVCIIYAPHLKVKHYFGKLGGSPEIRTPHQRIMSPLL